jgi:hypothetical protein
MVVLDAQKDWRFQNHPFVLGAPHIRFYAGAPLRTAEGYNVGSICIIDSHPRAEFPPRSRMALKEFAGVVVREMELWRDKVSPCSTSTYNGRCPFADIPIRSTLDGTDAAQSERQNSDQCECPMKAVCPGHGQLTDRLAPFRWSVSPANAWS